MKVEIRKDGTLLIKAETGLESYALERWYSQWLGRESSLMLDFNVAEDELSVESKTLVEPLK